VIPINTESKINKSNNQTTDSIEKFQADLNKNTYKTLKNIRTEIDSIF
jgi:hypothetical protein